MFSVFCCVWSLTYHSLFVCVFLFLFLDDAGTSVIVDDDPTSRGPTAASADPTATDPQSSAAPSPAPAAESTHVTPGKV